jgi:membrane-associated protein
MDLLSELFARLRDLPALVQWAGYVGLFAIIFTETGLFFGFFLPGDSLLVTAGLLVATRPEISQALDIRTLGLLLTAAAILGDNTNYWIGRLAGPRIFAKEDSLFFKRKHLARAAEFYERHGAKTVVLARFMPIVRTFAPLVAGAAHMNYRTFVTYSVTGGVAWIWSMLLIGYFLGSRVPGVARYLELVILAVIVLSLLPGLISWWRARQAARALASADVR